MTSTGKEPAQRVAQIDLVSFLRDPPARDVTNISGLARSGHSAMQRTERRQHTAEHR